jgi:hypothetical protein
MLQKFFVKKSKFYCTLLKSNLKFKDWIYVWKKFVKTLIKYPSFFLFRFKINWTCIRVALQNHRWTVSRIQILLKGAGVVRKSILCFTFIAFCDQIFRSPLRGFMRCPLISLSPPPPPSPFMYVHTSFFQSYCFFQVQDQTDCNLNPKFLSTCLLSTSESNSKSILTFFFSFSQQSTLQKLFSEKFRRNSKTKFKKLPQWDCSNKDENEKIKMQT